MTGRNAQHRRSDSANAVAVRVSLGHWQPLYHSPGVRDSSARRRSGHIPGRAPPTLVISRELKYQLYCIRRKRRSPWFLTVSGSIELTCYEFGMPSEDSIGFDYCRDSFESVSSESPTYFSKLSPFLIFQS